MYYKSLKPQNVKTLNLNLIYLLLYLIKFIPYFFNLPTIYSKKDNTMNEQTKHKISLALRGRKKSAVTRKRISQAMKRYRKSPQHKQAIAEAMRTVWQERTNKSKNRKNYEL